jgi:hypothetical protein
VQRLCAALSGEGWNEILANLPGYQPAAAAGRVLVMEDALPWWRKAQADARRRKHSVRRAHSVNR